MEQDVDTDDLEERAAMQHSKSKFSEMEPSTDQGALEGLLHLGSSNLKCWLRSPPVYVPGDTIGDEVPGSVRADTNVVKTQDMLLPQQQPGRANWFHQPVCVIILQQRAGLKAHATILHCIVMMLSSCSRYPGQHHKPHISTDGRPCTFCCNTQQIQSRRQSTWRSISFKYSIWCVACSHSAGDD